MSNTTPRFKKMIEHPAIARIVLTFVLFLFGGIAWDSAMFIAANPWLAVYALFIFVFGALVSRMNIIWS